MRKAKKALNGLWWGGYVGSVKIRCHNWRMTSNSPGDESIKGPGGGINDWNQFYDNCLSELYLHHDMATYGGFFDVGGPRIWICLRQQIDIFEDLETYALNWFGQRPTKSGLCRILVYSVKYSNSEKLKFTITWIWRKVEEISWTDHVPYADVLQRAE